MKPLALLELQLGRDDAMDELVAEYPEFTGAPAPMHPDAAVLPCRSAAVDHCPDCGAAHARRAPLSCADCGRSTGGPCDFLCPKCRAFENAQERRWEAERAA